MCLMAGVSEEGGKMWGNDAPDRPGGACTYMYLEVNTLLF